MRMESTFDEFTKRLGGRFSPPSSVSAYYSSLVEHLGEAAADHELEAADGKRILDSFDFVCSDSFNALAFVHRGMAYIGLFKGLVEKLVAYFETARNHRAWAANPMLASSLDPLDGLAIHLSTLALDFIFDHEITHLKHGHVDWLVANGLVAEYLEYDSTLSVGAHLDRQCLELDADFQATCRALALILVRRQRAVQAPHRYQRFPYARDARAALSVHWFVLYSLFLNFDDHTWTHADLQHRSHAPAALRLAMALAGMRGVAFKYWREEMQTLAIDEHIWDQLALQAIQAAHLTFCSVRGVSPMSLASPLKLAADNIAYLDEIRFRLYDLQPQLEPLARCKTIPPLYPRESRLSPDQHT